MEIQYTMEKRYSQKQVQELFRAVGWLSAEYPARLFRALSGAQTVLTAWDGERLVGLADVLDDGELTAYLHYLLVDPAYQGNGIGRGMLSRVKKKYRDYLYLLLIAEHEGLVDFYRDQGFEAMETGRVMVVCNRGQAGLG